MRTLSIILILALTSSLVSGQTSRNTPSEDQGDNYQTITTFGITTNTNSGILGGVSFRQSRRLPGEFFGMPQYRYLSVEVVNVKHPKELAASLTAGSRYIQGKENYLFVIRPQYGREVKLFQRDEDDGISVSGILAAGPSLGIIKPYYLDVAFGNSSRSVPASQVNGTSTATGEIVTGAGSIFQGFGQSKLSVGLNLKAALSFELSAFRTNTTGIEIGFLTEIFPQRIIIIPNTNPGANRADGNRNFFTSGYLTLFFGSKK
ncbi:MAG: hypothetical protein H7319_22495 [Spirosoma sp.]|nr:hypothetical protein [Spirosoma sp.]